MNTSPLVIAGTTLRSRLLLGTGKFGSHAAMAAALTGPSNALGGYVSDRLKNPPLVITGDTLIVRSDGPQVAVIGELRSSALDAQEELRRFFSLSLDCLSIAGFDGYLKKVNPAWEATLGGNGALFAGPGSRTSM